MDNFPQAVRQDYFSNCVPHYDRWVSIPCKLLYNMDCSWEWCFLATNVIRLYPAMWHAGFNISQWSNRDYHPSDGIGTCVETTACQIWVEKWSHSKFFEKRIPWVWNSRLSCPPAMDNGTETGKPMSVHPWRLAIINPNWGTALHHLPALNPYHYLL